MAVNEEHRQVTFDLDADTYYVLSSALSEWADSEAFHAEDDEPRLAADRHRHASRARELLELVEEALDLHLTPRTTDPGPASRPTADPRQPGTPLPGTATPAPSSHRPSK